MFSLVFLTIYGYITNSQCDQLLDVLDGLIAQLVEHCVGIGITAIINHVLIHFAAFHIFKLYCQLKKKCPDYDKKESERVDLFPRLIIPTF